MTQREWESERDPLVLLDYLFPMRGLDSVEEQTRQSRLYVAGCARQAWEQLPRIGRALAAVAERMLDPLPPDAALRRHAAALAEELTHCRGDTEALEELERRAILAGILSVPEEPEAVCDSTTWVSLAHLVYFPFAPTTPYYRRIAAEYHSVELLRDIFGVPPRSIHFKPSWLDRNVVGIAQGIAASRDFAPMPMLADALQDAGCGNEYILQHCRQPRHFRGCWVIEGLLRSKAKT